MAILVCGGAGYVGSHCLEGLRQAGFDCIVVDNLTRGHRAAVGDTPLYVGDISDPAFMDQVFAEHSICLLYTSNPTWRLNPTVL